MKKQNKIDSMIGHFIFAIFSASCSTRVSSKFENVIKCVQFSDLNQTFQE